MHGWPRYVSQLEGGVKRPTGPALVLLNVIRRKGTEAILFCMTIIQVVLFEGKKMGEARPCVAAAGVIKMSKSLTPFLFPLPR